MTSRERDIARAFRRARRLAESLDPVEYREGFALRGRLVRAFQWRGGCWHGAVNLARWGRRAELLDEMAAARRTGKIAAWHEARSWLAIWDMPPGDPGPWWWRPEE